jgi:hypothetical protein
MASFGYAAIVDDYGMPDPAAVPEAYEGVLPRRVLAYFVDLCVSAYCGYCSGSSLRCFGC